MNNTKDGDEEKEELESKSFKALIHRIWANTKKEVKVLWNDRFAMILLFLLPITLVFTINFSTSGIMGDGSSNLQVPAVGVLDLDESKGYNDHDLSKELVKIYEDYEAQGKCILYKDHSKSELDELLGKGEIDIYIIINDGFEFNLSIHFVGFLEVKIDSYNQLKLQSVESFLDESTTKFEDTFNLQGAIDQNITYVNVPERATKLFQVSPLFFPIVIFSMCCLVNSQSIIGDIPKDRMVLTPTSKKEILLGKILGSVIINSFMVAALWGLSLGLGMETRGDISTYFFILWTCSLAGTSIGLLISAASKTSLAAFQLFILSFISQVILLLFIEEKYILMFFPIWSTMRLMTEVILQGAPLLSSGFIIPYIFLLWGEFLIFSLLAYLIYKTKRSLI